MDRFQQLRILEAALFASDKPLKTEEICNFIPDIAESSNSKSLMESLLYELQNMYANRGVVLRYMADGWIFCSADDVGEYLTIYKKQTKKLSRAALETLAIIAYHQPITRAEIEDIRGVSLSRGTLDLLLEIEWIRPRGRKQTAGRPVTWGITNNFLQHFGLESIKSLPGLDELRASGLMDVGKNLGVIAMHDQDAQTDDMDDDGDILLNNDENEQDVAVDLLDEKLSNLLHGRL